MTIKKEKQIYIKGLKELGHTSNKADKLDAILKNLTTDKAYKTPLIPPRKRPTLDKVPTTKATSLKTNTFVISLMEINYETQDNSESNEISTPIEKPTDILKNPKENTTLLNTTQNSTQKLATTNKNIISDETKP